MTSTRDLGKQGDGDFDLIVIDVDHSPEDVLGDQSNQFYSESGLEDCQNSLETKWRDWNLVLRGKLAASRKHEKRFRRRFG